MPARRRMKRALSSLVRAGEAKALRMWHEMAVERHVAPTAGSDTAPACGAAGTRMGAARAAELVRRDMELAGEAWLREQQARLAEREAGAEQARFEREHLDRADAVEPLLSCVQRRRRPW